MGKLPDSIARDIASPAVKMGNGSLFPGVAVPRAFFGTFFRFERKYCPLRGGSPSIRARVGASIPAKKFPYSIAIVYSGLQMTFRVANNRQISKRRHPASFPQIYRFALLLLNWAIIRNFFSLALI